MVLATWYMEKEGMKEAGMQRETGGGRGGRGGDGGWWDYSEISTLERKRMRRERRIRRHSVSPCCPLPVAGAP